MAPYHSSETLSHNGRDVTQQPLPAIIEARYHTQKPSLSPYFLEGQYLAWPDFENDVRKNFERQNWGNSIISVRRALPSQFDIVNEMFQCGDELSLSGRFVQQALHVMTAVGRDLGIPVRFGDFRTVYTPEREKQRIEEERRGGAGQLSESMSQDVSEDMSQPEDAENKKARQSQDPDFAAVNDSDRVRFVGEIKTPWTQSFEKSQSVDSRWRRWIGQIAQYMKTYNLRYGFWTTYNETVFLKQEQNDEGRWHLRVSNIIKFNTKSDLTRRANDNLTACVSLRECMLFLMCATNRPDSEVYVRNDDPLFIKNVHQKSEKSALKLNPRTTRKLGQPAESSAKEIEAQKKSELERQSRSRQERAAKREIRAPVSSRPLDTLSEKSRDPPARRSSPPPETTDPLKPKLSDSSRSSSASSRQRVQQISSEEVPKSRSVSSERGRPGRRDPPEASPITALGKRRLSKKAVPSTEAKGKQKAQSSSSSEERRAQSNAPPGRGQGSPGERSSSAGRRARGYAEEPEEGSENDLYGTSGDENRPPNTIPFRPSRGRSPLPPQVPPHPAQQSALAQSTQGSQPTSQRPAPDAATGSNRPSAQPPAQAEASTRRSTRRRHQQQQQQQQEPRSPVKKLLDKFHRK